MKKLSLKNLNLGVKDLLQREQLKSVFGGYNFGYYKCCDIIGGGGCSTCVRCDDSCECSNGGVLVACSFEA